MFAFLSIGTKSDQEVINNKQLLVKNIPQSFIKWDKARTRPDMTTFFSPLRGIRATNGDPVGPRGEPVGAFGGPPGTSVFKRSDGAGALDPPFQEI